MIQKLTCDPHWVKIFLFKNLYYQTKLGLIVLRGGPLGVGTCVLSRVWLLVTFLCPLNFPSKNSGVSCHFLLQDIFPTKGSNPSPALQVDSFPLSHLGSPWTSKIMYNRIEVKVRLLTESHIKTSIVMDCFLKPVIPWPAVRTDTKIQDPSLVLTEIHRFIFMCGYCSHLTC